MPEADRRAQIVAAARGWIGTPYHHAADIPRAGVDCAMLLVRVYCDLGIVERFDPRPYPQFWYLHRDEERFMGHLLARADEVAAPLAGDILLFKIGRCYAHGGIVVDAAPLTFVHAFAPARRVVEDRLDRSAELLARPRKFFSFCAGRRAR